MNHDKKPNLLRIVLSRNQTKETVCKNLLEGHKYLQNLQNHGDGYVNVEVDVDIRGFERDVRHPACIKDAKRCFILAFEGGLAGLLVEAGNNNSLICEVYSMAYLKGKVKMMGGKRVVKFQKANEFEFNAKTLESCDVYLKLIESNTQKK